MGLFTLTLSEVLELGETVFDDQPENQYPLFNEAYREGLNRKILDHYMNYEIGQETIEKFRFALNRKMREIMPYYNQLYKSTLIAIDPLATVDYNDDATTHNSDNASTHDTGSATSHSTGNSTSTTDSKSRAVTSETPQTHLSGNEDYATGATDSIGNSSVNGDSASDATQSSSADGTISRNADGTISRNIKGSQGHQATLLMQYRKSFLNIDMNVISDLESLFMAVWDNGDEFNASNGAMTYGHFGFSTLF